MKPIRDDLPNRASPQNHLDEVRLVVRLTRAPREDIRRTTSGLLCRWGGPLAVSLEDAARYSAAVAWNEEREIFEPFVSIQQYKQVERDASGAALEFAVEVLNNVAVESVMLGMGYAIAKMRGKRERPSRLLRAAETMSQDVMLATAAVFEIDPDDLEVIDRNENGPQEGHDLNEERGSPVPGDSEAARQRRPRHVRRARRLRPRQP